MGPIEVPHVEEIACRFAKLQEALKRALPRDRCLRRWSEFIRERDGHRCLDCHSRNRLSAHHIARKSFLPLAQFDTGNGITLCSACHRKLHLGFNRRPDPSQPVDAQGGEKLPSMERLYSILTDDAVDRGLMCRDYYFLSDDLLCRFKRMQGYQPDCAFPGSRVEQAYLILAETEYGARRAVAEANGVSPPPRPLLPGGIFMVIGGVGGTPGRSMVLQTYKPRSELDVCRPAPTSAPPADLSG